MQRVSSAIAICAIALMVSGCAGRGDAPAPQPSEITLQEARMFQNKTLLDLGGYVETEAIIGGMQGPIPRMAGLSCDWAAGPSADAEISGILLPGGYDIEVASGTDLDAVRSEIEKTYSAVGGWETKWSEHDGDRELLLVSPEKYEFYLSAYVVGASGNLRLDISSFSPCLQAPEGFTLSDEY